MKDAWGTRGDVKRRTLNRKEKVIMHYSMRNCSLLSKPIDARQ